MAPSQVIISQGSIWLSIQTSIVFPLEAVSMSPGLMPPPLLMFSQAANNEIDLSWTYHISRAKTG
jgi:hypothetical protein